MLLLLLLFLPTACGVPQPLAADWGHGWDTAGSMLWVDIAARAGPLTPTQLQFLADTYSIVSLEKCFNLAQFPGSTEGGARNASAALHALNPAIKVTFYFHRRKYFANCYESNAAFNASSWAAVSDSGEPFAPILYNTSLPEVQRYITSATVLAEDGSAPDGQPYFDGVFADGSADASSTYGISAERFADITNGSHASLALTQAAVRQAMRPGARVIGNGITMYSGNPPDHGLAVLPWVDGLCMEHFLAFEQLDRQTGATTPQMFAVVRSAILNATAAGKVVLVKGWPGPACAPIGALGPSWCGNAASPLLATAAGRGSASPQLLLPTLAGFLVLSNRLTFLSYTWWYDQNSGGVPCAPGSEAQCTFPSTGWFPELAQPLGPPLADAAVSQDGVLYTREFLHASVRFNAANVSNSSIVWRLPSPSAQPSSSAQPSPSTQPSSSAQPSASAAAAASPLGSAAQAAQPLSSGPAAGVALAALAVAGACALAGRSALARGRQGRAALTAPASVALNPVWGEGRSSRGRREWGVKAAATAPRKGSVAAMTPG